jgi:hypothetical protein
MEFLNQVAALGVGLAIALLAVRLLLEGVLALAFRPAADLKRKAGMAGL